MTFGDNGKGHIIGISKICITPSTFTENVLLVDELKQNLLSISQLGDKGFQVVFKSLICIVSSPIDNDNILFGHRYENIYMVDLDDHSIKHGQCLMAMNAKVNETSWLWHHRLGYASMNSISKLIKKDFVKGLPNFNFEKDKICNACQFRKQTTFFF